MKKTILILSGLIVTFSIIIYTIYQHQKEEKEDVVDIFEKKDSNVDEKKETNTNETKKDDNSNKVTVDIKGMVANPGVYTVDVNTRVNDVITLAGGLLENADTSLINLAKIVTDEMTIIVYSKDEVAERQTKDEPLVCDCPIITNDACLNSEEKNDELININTATKEELMTIDGIGESKADNIIKYREENGPFKTIENIQNVSGIGASLFEKIKAFITVQVPI